MVVRRSALTASVSVAITNAFVAAIASQLAATDVVAVIEESSIVRATMGAVEMCPGTPWEQDASVVCAFFYLCCVWVLLLLCASG